MRKRAWFKCGLSLLLGFGPLLTLSCSSQEQQQQEEVVENSEGEAQGGDEGNTTGNANTEETFAETQPPAVPTPPVTQQQELQEIIDGMNQQPGVGAGATGELGGVPLEAQAPAPAPAPVPTTPVEQQQAAAGMAAAPGLPELGSKMSYVVKRGDTLAKVATKIYGDIDKWREISDFTGMADPNMIYPGDVIYYQLTDQTMAFASAYEAVARAEVVVQPGDTLSTISSKVMGSSQDWKMIWRQNDNIDNPDVLTVGQTIYYINPSSLVAQASPREESVIVATELQDETKVDLGQVIDASQLVNAAPNEFETEIVKLNSFEIESFI